MRAIQPSVNHRYIPPTDIEERIRAHQERVERECPPEQRGDWKEQSGERLLQKAKIIAQAIRTRGMLTAPELCEVGICSDHTFRKIRKKTGWFCLICIGRRRYWGLTEEGRIAC